MERIEPFNPLDKQHLGEIVASALLKEPSSSLPPSDNFLGAGIHAIYYFGTFPSYLPIQKANPKGQLGWPIYVGKAVPKGARKGNVGLDIPVGNVLYGRLRKHAQSIEQAENLRLEDFACQFLVVDDIWIPLAESLLIGRFSPLWNQIIDGFGNHDPGQRRASQNRSAWDVLHPGRPWAEKLSDHPLSRDQLLTKIEEYFASKRNAF